MSEIVSLNEELNRMIGEGKMMEAFERFYADDVVMMENDTAFVGKDVNRKREEEFFSSIREVHGAGITSTAVGGELSFTEMWFDATYANGHRAKLEEVAVRRWKDGKVVHERFYYKGQ